MSGECKSGPLESGPPLLVLLNSLLLFRTRAAWSMQRRNFLADDWIVWSFVNIDLRPMSIIFGNVSIGEDRLDRTFRNAGIAIDTSVGIDVKTIGKFVKSFHRTDSRAVGIFAINT